MRHSFEYYALRYLLLWETEERALHSLMKNDPSQALRKSRQHFGIARSFKGIGDEGKTTLVLNALQRLSDDGTTSSACKNVVALANQFNVDFDRYNLSAASKLLWLNISKPIHYLRLSSGRGP